MLKQSFTNINRARNGSNEMVENFSLIEEESPEAREERVRRTHNKACWAGVATLFG